MSQIGGYVPTNHKAAMEQIANERSGAHGGRVTISDLLRDAVELWLASQDPDDLPEETLDLLDDDLLANAGGNGGS